MKSSDVRDIKKKTVRPTPALVRKAIFDILQKVEGKTFVDLYAGKGFVGLEALKRGAKEVIFVERDPVLCIFIKKSLHKNKIFERARIYNLDTVKFLHETSIQYDVIFADPPYESGELDRIFKILDKKNILKEDGVIIFQHHKKESLKENLKDLKIHKCYRYGDALLTVYRRRKE
jgi:16S rRNA (guanine966-N2)-methyltransferase